MVHERKSPLRIVREIAKTSVSLKPVDPAGPAKFATSLSVNIHDVLRESRLIEDSTTGGLYLAAGGLGATTLCLMGGAIAGILEQNLGGGLLAGEVLALLPETVTVVGAAITTFPEWVSALVWIPTIIGAEVVSILPQMGKSIIRRGMQTVTYLQQKK